MRHVHHQRTGSERVVVGVGLHWQMDNHVLVELVCEPGEVFCVRREGQNGIGEGLVQLYSGARVAVVIADVINDDCDIGNRRRCLRDEQAGRSDCARNV